MIERDRLRTERRGVGVRERDRLRTERRGVGVRERDRLRTERRGVGVIERDRLRTEKKTCNHCKKTAIGGHHVATASERQGARGR